MNYWSPAQPGRFRTRRWRSCPCLLRALTNSLNYCLPASLSESRIANASTE
jgi:hypothetical protein